MDEFFKTTVMWTPNSSDIQKPEEFRQVMLKDKHGRYSAGHWFHGHWWAYKNDFDKSAVVEYRELTDKERAAVTIHRKDSTQQSLFTP